MGTSVSWELVPRVVELVGGGGASSTETIRVVAGGGWLVVVLAAYFIPVRVVEELLGLLGLLLVCQWVVEYLK